MDAAIAENLFVAISTDTGSFQYPNTTARTFEIGAELLRCGVNVGRVSQLLYESYPRRRVELLRELLGTMRFEGHGKIASFSLSLETAAKLGARPEVNEGLIDHIRAIKGVVVAVFFEELPEGKVRVSMRSKSDAADVCAICEKFGGGGHKLAAGARARGTLAEVFGSGTAAVISPVGELGLPERRLTVGTGTIGPIAQRLYDEISGIQSGTRPDRHGWLSAVYSPSANTRPIAMPATGALMGTPASIIDSDDEHTDAMDVEPLDDSASDTRRMV